MKTILIVLFWSFTYQLHSQFIRGSLISESGEMVFNDFTVVKTAEVSTTCEYPGYFELHTLRAIDTLVIIPISFHIKVKIYNFPEELDTVNLDSIPIFEKKLDEIPIITFRTKRAAKKYFKEFEKQKVREEKEFVKKIENTLFYWNNRLIPLHVRRQDDTFEVLIDLGS